MGKALLTVFCSTGALLAASAAMPLMAQETADPATPVAATTDIMVTGTPPADLSPFESGPQIEGTISARRGETLQISGADMARNQVMISEGTEVRGRGGFLGLNNRPLETADLVNGLPVTIDTVQWGDVLVAKRIRLRTGDLRTARMIRDGTEQGFAEQTEATNALRGRFGEIDQYNIRRTVNVYFDSGRWQLSPQAEQQLCATTSEAQAINNALLLVVGYTDAVGSEDFNQELSERRASRVVNFIQQRCRWAPYRMLMPTGMSESDPTADNSTAEGRAQNRRVSVSILTSKAADGV